MIAAVILLSLLLGAAFAYAADYMPAHVVALERCGGTLMVASLALLGAQFPVFY